MTRWGDVRWGALAGRWMAAVVLGWMGIAEPAGADCPIQLHDITKETRVAFRHTDGSSGRRYIVETVCCGLATFDYDGDGKIDIYFLSGRPLRGTKVEGPAPRNALYRNLGDWRFADVTQKAGVGDAGYGMAVAVGDYDSDGHADLYVTNFGPNVLYHNNGDGTFADVTKRAGVANGSKVGAGACFLDMDKDGDLDLFASAYLKFSYDLKVPTRLKGQPVYPGPQHYPPETSTLYRNEGNATFTDVSRSSGISAEAGWGMGTVAADYDHDGDTDIFVANDVSENFLWQNDGRGVFEQVGITSGVAFDFDGTAQGSMGVDCADYNNDGLLDFFVTAYQRQIAPLYKNLGQGLFEDVSRTSGAGVGTFRTVTWGCGFVDLDNDGFRDLFIPCGHLLDNIDAIDDTTSYLARNIVMRNTGDGRFVDVSDEAGDGMQVKLSSRGAAYDDLDNDGDVDVVVLNSRREPTILRNLLQEKGSKNHWVQIQLRGTKTNRDGVGARVNVVAGDLSQIDEVHSGRGYQSHFGSRLHFGLGQHARIDRIEVHWIGGKAESFDGAAVDRLLTLVEGSGKAVKAAQPAP